MVLLVLLVEKLYPVAGIFPGVIEFKVARGLPSHITAFNFQMKLMSETLMGLPHSEAKTERVEDTG